MATFTATPFKGFGLSAVTNGPAFGATHRLSSIVESRYARNYIPKFQAELDVAEEEPNGPRERLVERFSNRRRLTKPLATYPPGVGCQH